MSNNKKEKSIKKKIIYRGRILKLNVDKVSCPNGHQSFREIVHHRGGVAILPIVDNKIVLIKQYRYAFKEELFEVPAGKLEKNENPKDAAIRELEEEVGLLDNDLISLGKMYPTCGYSDEIIHLYVSQNSKKCERHLDADENIDIYYFDVDEVRKMIESGQIKDAKTIIVFFKYFNNMA